ncbi:hypothetical protein Tco_0704890 [Tanacetum coccineum]|uniref:Retrovirus-related Pol polyprotein from transposon TNT 1-94-like beta-barrel domain-containing protein n=1 Tax=Tanacetum coccineum TaxID=301880 RepID=A0ABQ4Y3A7_9ASTR
MVISSPCLTDIRIGYKELASPGLNSSWFSIHLVVYNEELDIPEQTATGKGTSNLLMAGSLPKTTKPTYQVSVKLKTRLGYNAASSTAASPAVESFVNSSKMLENQEYNNENMDVTTIVTPSNVKIVESNHESTDVKSNGDVEFIPNVEDKTVRPSTEKIKFVKSARETVEKGTGKINTAGINVNTAGANINTVNIPINTAASTPNVNHPRPKSNAFERGYSQSSRPFNRYFAKKNSIFNTNVNTARHAGATHNRRSIRKKAVIDSGCSRHMTGNNCYLDEYEDYDGGFVSFGDGKGIIFRKGKIKTGSLDFDDVYFYKELKYKLFSVSQICYKKNNVSFSNTECLVLSSDFKLLDES